MRKLVLIALFVFNSSLYAQTLTSVRPWLGVAIEKGAIGVKVKSAFPDTPAAKAGLVADDEIVSISGVVVKTPEDLINQVVTKGVGFTVSVDFLRQGKKESKEMTLVLMPDVLDMTKKKLLNKPAPDFKASDVRNSKKKISLKTYLGKPVILEFWATWCPACVGSMPRLIQFAKNYKGKIQILSISMEETQIVKKYLAKMDKNFSKEGNHITYIQSADKEILREYMASSIPMFILIDKKGDVVDLNLGGGSVLEAILTNATSLL